MPTNSSSPEVENVLNKLQGVKADGSGWMARCPCRNDDRHQSLHVAEGEDGRALMKCYRGDGCDTADICDAMGITVRDLFPAQDEERVLEKTYRYEDENGKLLFEKLRYRILATGAKTFVQRKPENGDWTYRLGDTPKVLYRLPEVIAAVKRGDRIIVTEGEKDADTIRDLGYVATTMPGGAGKWLDIHTQTLAGARVLILQDNDPVGEDHARKVKKALEGAGCTVNVKAAPHPYKDVTDLVQKGGRLTDLVDAVDTRDPLDIVIETAEDLKDRNGSITSKLARIRNTIALLEVSRQEEIEARNWEEMLNEEVDDSYDWVIDDLLERQERVIFVAAEGVGKTMLQRQVAICTAAGLHPFTGARIQPLRTLTWDLENPEKIIRRSSRAIMERVRERTWMKKTDKIQAEFYSRPSGINLFKPEEQAILEGMIKRIQPDILFIGPLYKAFIEQPNKSAEAQATELAMYFDYLRTTYDMALWMEQHAPLGNSVQGRDLRPFGSSVWSRWPEFGLSLELDPTEPGSYNVKTFRGSRDQRPWPTKMHRGERGVDLPFVVDDYNRTI